MTLQQTKNQFTDNDDCGNGCGICQLCGVRFAKGACCHTALISGIDQGGHQAKYHNMKDHLMKYEYPGLRNADDFEIQEYIDRLYDRCQNSYSWDLDRYFNFIHDIEDPTLADPIHRKSHLDSRCTCGSRFISNDSLQDHLLESN
jgi:hypothetical protein